MIVNARVMAVFTKTTTGYRMPRPPQRQMTPRVARDSDPWSTPRVASERLTSAHYPLVFSDAAEPRTMPS